MAKNYISNKPETVRMFRSNFFEVFSKVHPVVPVIVFLPIIFYFMHSAIVMENLDFLHSVFYFLVGILIWTLTEYLLHRFVFHFIPKSAIGKKLHFVFHGVHHDYPNDPLRLVMPPAVSLPLASFFYLVFLYLLGEVIIYPFFAGFLTGYLFYDITHYAVHHSSMKNKFFLSLKKHHMRHHYQNPNLGYGVSSLMWDKLIGTDFNKNNKQLLDEI